MSPQPQPQITPPPKRPLPRQNDPYGLSSLYAELSSLYPDLYSSYTFDESYYSSLLADLTAYESLYSYSIPDFNSLLSAATATATARGTDSPSNPTASAANANQSGGGNSGGLSTGAKIGIGVAVPVGVLILVGIGVFLWCAGKRKGKKNGTTIVQPPTAQAQFQPQPYQPPQQQQNYPTNQQGYIQGYQPTPPPQYMQPQQNPNVAYGGYAKEPQPGVVEMEHEYHFPSQQGAVEMGDGAPVPQQNNGRK